MIPLWVLFKRQLRKEALLQGRQPRFILNACLFFLMILVFFSLTMPPDPHLLRVVVPGMIWTALLLSMLLSADRLFQSDHDDGVIEQWLVSPYPLSIWVVSKLLMNWTFTVLPIVLLCPLLTLLFALSVHETVILTLSLLCGSPVLLFLCALAAAFGTGLKQQGVLMALIVLPLTVPVLILGSGTLSAALQDLPVSGYFALLLAMSCLAVGCLPWAIAGVIRIGLVE